MWKLIKKSWKWSHSRWSAKTSKWFRALSPSLHPALTHTSLHFFLSFPVALQRSPLLPRNTKLSASISHTLFGSISSFKTHTHTHTLWHDEICFYIHKKEKKRRHQRQKQNNIHKQPPLLLFFYSISQLILDMLMSLTRQQTHQQ